VDRDDNNLGPSLEPKPVGDWKQCDRRTPSTSPHARPDATNCSPPAAKRSRTTQGNQTILPADATSGQRRDSAMEWDLKQPDLSGHRQPTAVATFTYQWDALGRRVVRDGWHNNTVCPVQFPANRRSPDYTSGNRQRPGPTVQTTALRQLYIDRTRFVRAEPRENRYLPSRQQLTGVIARTNPGPGVLLSGTPYSAYGTHLPDHQPPPERTHDELRETTVHVHRSVQFG